MPAVMMNGTRLAYVVVEQLDEDGKPFMVERVHTLWDKKTKSIVRKKVEEPAGFLVYFPRGHVIRIKDLKTLRHYNLNQDAPIINMEGLTDPKSPLGRMMLAQDDAARKGAMDDLRKQVINMAVAHAGHVEVAKTEEIPEELLDL